MRTEPKVICVHPANLRSSAFRLLPFLVCAGAFALRAYHLGAQSIWLDEGATFSFASLPLGDVVAATFSREPNPPLYYVLVHLWMSLAGQSEFALRFPSLVFGVLTVALVYRLGREMLGEAAGLAAATLAAVNPYLVWYSQEARMYALLAALATATLLALWRGLARPRWGTALAFGLLLTATLYSHFYGVFVALVCGAWLVVASLPPSPAGKGVRGLGLSLLLAVAAFLPWLAANLQAGAARESWREALGPIEVVERSLVAFTSGGFLGNRTGLALALGEAALVALGLAAAWRLGARAKPAVGGEQRSALFLLAALALPTLGVIALSQRQAFYADRYVIAQAPLFLIAVAAGLALPIRRWPAVGAGLLAALVVASGVGLYRETTLPQYRKEDFRAASAYLAGHAAPGDLVILVADYVDMPLDYYYGRVGNAGEVLPFAGDVANPGPALDTKLAGRERVWLLLSHAESVDPSDKLRAWLGGHFPLLTEQYPQGIRLFGWRADYRRADLPAGATPTSLRFGDKVELVGYQTESGVSPRDDRLHPPSNWLHVTLYWRALAPVGADYHSSVQMVDARGVWGDRLTHGSEALYFYPTSKWQPGEIVVEDVDVNLNPVTPPGQFGLQVNLLDGAGQPLPVSGGSSVLRQVEITK